MEWCSLGKRNNLIINQKLQTMKTTNYEPIATNVVNRLNEKFASVDVDDLIDEIPY